MECEKKTISGNLLDVDFYPVWENGSKMPIRPSGCKPSSEAQKKYNNNKAIKNAVRQINANFISGDILMALTYDQNFAPQDFEGAARDLSNYIRRIKTKIASEKSRIKKLLKTDPANELLKKQLKNLNRPFKWYCTIEEVTYKSGSKCGQKNYHMHLFMTANIDRDTAESIWHKGVRVNAMRFKPECFGPEAAARYISKDPQGRKRFRHSKNLDKPVTKKKNGGVTPRTVELMAKQRVDDKEYWERRYKGYRFVRCFARFNKYNSHWYVTVIMYKADPDSVLPDWSFNEDEWTDEF